MTNVLDKKDWVCTQPFEFAEIFDHKMFMCCPNWLPENLGNPNNILENFKSDIETINIIKSFDAMKKSKEYMSEIEDLFEDLSDDLPVEKEEWWKQV